MAGQLVGQASKILGWTWQDIETDGSPQQVGNAWVTAIRDKASAILGQGSPRAEVATYIKQATAAGIAVILESTPDTAGDGVLAVTNGNGFVAAEGKSMATWVANDAQQSGASSAGVLYVNLPDFPILTSLKTSFVSSMQQDCSTCQVSDLDVGLTGLQQAPAQVISYLRAHPAIKYVAFSASNAFDTVPPAIKAAGLSVKIIGTTASNTTLDQLRSGTVTAEVAFNNYEQAFQVVDILARHFAGVDTSDPASAAIPPQWILTKANVPADDVFPIVPGVVEQYTKLWGK